MVGIYHPEDHGACWVCIPGCT